MFRYLTNMTKLAHNVMKEYLQEGMIVMDGTVGNGHDTVFLADAVGKSGRVYGFDIQQQAISSTQQNLLRHNLLDRVTIIKDGHENLDQYIKEPIDAAMYNLGYLPKGDHSIITRPNTTLLSLERCLHQLKPHGMVSIAVYYGHEGGNEEKLAVENYLSSLDHKRYTVMNLQFFNKKNDPPQLFIIEKAEQNF